MSKKDINIELNKQSKANLDKQFAKLKRFAPEKARHGLVKILFDIKYLAQDKLKSDRHIVTSRLRNSIYVQTPKPTQTIDNSENYTDKDGKSYNSKLNVQLTDNEAAVGTNVEYGLKIEYGYDSFLYWAAKNVNLNKRAREISKELLGDLTAR